MRVIELGRNERIVSVVPEKVSGPGWSNAIAWVHITDDCGSFRTECLQPEDHSHEMILLFEIGAVVCAQLASSIPTKRAR